ncbi:MAG TPA: hypothetical protein VH518_22630 [Tepidisphaeraceae bacterium]
MVAQNRIAGIVVALGVAFVLCATARGLQTQPTGEPVVSTTGPGGEAAPAPESMRVIVVEVQGTVRVKPTPDAQWQPATVDMVVGEQAEFRTGARSSVTCVIPPDQSFTLDRLGALSVLEAIREGKTVKTDLALKYGRVRYDIEAAGVEHRAVIRSPSSTLAVRGTDVVLYDQPPFLPDAQSYTGRAMFGYAKRLVPVGGKAYAKVAAGDAGAADTALAASVIDPRSTLSRSETDRQLIENETSRGAVLFFDPIANINVIRGGAGPLPDSTFAQNPPGALNFFLRWTGNADLNLTVTFQGGDPDAIISSFNFQPTDILYPGYSLDTTPSGGHIAFDHRGGPNGGTEIGYWQKVLPGVYGISARNISGETANFKFNVVDDKGHAYRIFTEEFTVGTQIQRTLAPGGEIVGIVPIPDSKFLDLFPPEPGSSSAPQSRTATRAPAVWTTTHVPLAVPKNLQIQSVNNVAGPRLPVAGPMRSK